MPIELEDFRLPFDSSPSASIIYLGEAYRVLKEFPDNSIQMGVTSPPYWGLRDYDTPEQLGAEDDVDEYADKLVKILREVRRVLKNNGIFWLNIGDCYTSGGRTWRAPDSKNPNRAMTYRAPTPEGLKPKDLVGVPWRVVTKLQRDGWYVRSEIIWNKPNAHPESVKDRPTRSHEFIFLLTKSERYYYDPQAMREVGLNGKTRNKRDVWNINTKPSGTSHPAVFPDDLIIPCILAGSKEGDFILDPFFGSGTTGLVATRYKRKFVGIDISENYVSEASERLRKNGVNFLTVKKRVNAEESFPPILPTIQISFYSRLKEAKSEYLLPALLDYVSTLDISKIDKELMEFVGSEKLSFLAKYGLRGELIFPVPYILNGYPKLFAYYRLLLGFSRKQMQSTRPFGQFIKMEDEGKTSSRIVENLPLLCQSFIESAWLLINNIPEVSKEVLDALTILTLGGQFRGSYNNLIGQRATRSVFEIFKSIVKPNIHTESKNSLMIRNIEGNFYTLDFSSDPDISIREISETGKFSNKIAVEIKGGRDVSNIHNRIGEAEKSHQKAKRSGYTHFWTILRAHVDLETAKIESPTTDTFFLLDEIEQDSSTAYKSLQTMLYTELSLK